MVNRKHIRRGAKHVVDADQQTSTVAWSVTFKGVRSETTAEKLERGLDDWAERIEVSRSNYSQKDRVLELSLSGPETTVDAALAARGSRYNNGYQVQDQAAAPSAV